MRLVASQEPGSVRDWVFGKGSDLLIGKIKFQALQGVAKFADGFDLPQHRCGDEEATRIKGRRRVIGVGIRYKAGL